MTDDRSLERAARSWLDEGPTRAPDRPVDAALRTIQSTSQERDLRIPWRFPRMTPFARSALIAAIGVIAVGTAIYVIQRPLGTGGPPASSPTASPLALSIAGTWDAEFTHEQFVAAGLVDAAEDNTENWGHFRMVFGAGADGASGTFHIIQLDGPQSSGSGTYTISGSTLTIHCSGWCDNDAVFVLSFTLTPTTLTIGAAGPATFHVEPWTRIGT